MLSKSIGNKNIPAFCKAQKEDILCLYKEMLKRHTLEVWMQVKSCNL